jgi:ATP-dependent exoDNAse (exonuclease V) alpha subunit
MSGIQQRLADNYKEGQVVFFQQQAGNIKKGTQAAIIEKDSNQNTLKLKYWDKEKGSYQNADIDLSQNGKKLKAFNVEGKNFGVGDRVILQKNDKRLGVSNGNIGTIQTIDLEGNATIALTAKDKNGNSKKVECNLSNKGDKAYNYLDHAYSITQYKSQGATFDKSIINNSSEYKTNFNAMYVSITRAKHDVSIYTNDKASMIDQALVEQSKGSTLDFTKPQKHYNMLKNQRNQFGKDFRSTEKQRDRNIER